MGRAGRIPACLALIAGLFGCGDPGATAGSESLPDPSADAPLAVIGQVPGESTLALAGLDGRVSSVVANGPFRQAAEPAWSPDGRRLVFTGVIGQRHGDRFVYSATDLFAVSSDGDGLRRLTSGEDARTAAVSPDGSWIAFVRFPHLGERPFTSTLWLMGADGGEQHRIFADVDGRTDGLPAWSADGTRIAFTRCNLPDDLPLRRIPCAVWTVAPNGSGVARIADHAYGPAWSPDGRWIAYSTDADANGVLRTGEDESAYAPELYLMHPDGSGRTRLTRTKTVGEESPSWSPDGRWIAYARTGPADFTRSVFVMRPDGTCQTAVLPTAGRRSYASPAWRPGTGDVNPPGR
jgi:TolB protein